MTYMWHYYREAEKLDSTVNSSEPSDLYLTLGAIRKLAALGVACMEENGAILRHFNESNPRHLAIVEFAPHAISRSDVYLVIEQERAHQDNAWGNDGNETSEELTIIRRYLGCADESWVHNVGDIKALQEIRKVVATAVRCMQNHGAPRGPGNDGKIGTFFEHLNLTRPSGSQQ